MLCGFPAVSLITEKPAFWSARPCSAVAAASHGPGADAVSAKLTSCVKCAPWCKSDHGRGAFLGAWLNLTVEGPGAGRNFLTPGPTPMTARALLARGQSAPDCPYILLTRGRRATRPCTALAPSIGRRPSASREKSLTSRWNCSIVYARRGARQGFPASARLSAIINCLRSLPVRGNR